MMSESEMRSRKEECEKDGHLVKEDISSCICGCNSVTYYCPRCYHYFGREKPD